jgi:hypothetical protein
MNMPNKIILVTLVILLSGCASIETLDKRPPSATREYSDPFKKVYFAALKAVPLMSWEVETTNIEAGEILAVKRDADFGVSLLYVRFLVRSLDNQTTEIVATVDGSGYIGGHSVLEKKLPTYFTHVSLLLTE